VPLDPHQLPRDVETLRKIVVDLAEQLDRSLAEQNKYQSLLRELLEAQRSRKSERFRKSSGLCSRRPGRRGVRKRNPLPRTRTTMIWTRRRDPGRDRTKHPTGNGAAASRWPGI